jgi:hypothetical protein
MLEIHKKCLTPHSTQSYHQFFFSSLSLSPVEHGDEGASHSADPNPFPNSRMSNDIERIEDLEDSDSDNGEFITIKVTNTEGQIEPQEADHIKEHQQHQKMR